MRMRTLCHLILSCLLFTAVVAPSASAHDSHHRRNGGEQGSHDRDHHRGEGRGRGQVSFFGAPGHADCSRETMSCDYLFSRSASAELHERLSWILSEHLDGVERLADRLCRRAEQENECAGNFIAGLYNGLDALEIAIAESSCATVHLAWSKKDGLSQGWATTTGDKCTD